MLPCNDSCVHFIRSLCAKHPRVENVFRPRASRKPQCCRASRSRTDPKTRFSAMVEFPGFSCELSVRVQHKWCRFPGAEGGGKETPQHTDLLFSRWYLEILLSVPCQRTLSQQDAAVCRDLGRFSNDGQRRSMGLMGSVLACEASTTRARNVQFCSVPSFPPLEMVSSLSVQGVSQLFACYQGLISILRGGNWGSITGS